MWSRMLVTKSRTPRRFSPGKDDYIFLQYTPAVAAG